ncbi:hypothetical protein [Kitasatospora griseola]|uniref:hypothetical protein n=1 Tax=Kitasatospora griseola TaxID=2064 RepID=UPI00342CE584
MYAIGDLADLPEADMAGFAMQHAEMVAKNISAQLRGEQPVEVYRPLGHPMILLPLGIRGGVGQLPSPDGPFAAPTAMVSESEGVDLFTGRFLGRFGPNAARAKAPVRGPGPSRGDGGVSRSGARPRSRSRR